LTKIKARAPFTANISCSWRIPMLVSRLLAAVAVLCTGCSPVTGSGPQTPLAVEDGPIEAVERGRRLAADACASCHALGPVGVSPMAEATPFRVIVDRRPLDQLEAGFAEGLVTSHPAMPDLVFRASEIDDLIAYLETVKAEP
jgi:mono/diheme cytochrome c family protein